MRYFSSEVQLSRLGTSDWTPTDGVIIDSGVDSSTVAKEAQPIVCGLITNIPTTTELTVVMLSVIVKTTLVPHGLKR